MANHHSDYGKMIECRRASRQTQAEARSEEVLRPREGYSVQPREDGLFVLRRHIPVHDTKYGLRRLQEVQDVILAVGTEKEMDAKAAELMQAEKALADAVKEARKNQRKK
jgi:hypothetical protein